MRQLASAPMPFKVGKLMPTPNSTSYAEVTLIRFTCALTERMLEERYRHQQQGERGRRVVRQRRGSFDWRISPVTYGL